MAGRVETEFTNSTGTARAQMAESPAIAIIRYMFADDRLKECTKYSLQWYTYLPQYLLGMGNSENETLDDRCPSLKLESETCTVPMVFDRI